MPISPELPQQLAAKMYRIASDSELTMINYIAGQIGKGLEAPNWATLKLGQVQALQAQIEREAAQLYGVSRVEVTDAVLSAAQAGVKAAIADIPVGLVRAIGGTGVPPNSDAALILARDAVTSIRGTHPVILRTTMDAYRQAVAEVSGRAILGVQTRREVAQEVLDRFARKGISGFVDKAGRRWELASYVEMATRTAVMKAQNEAFVGQLTAQGVDLVQVSNAPQECKLCVVPGTLVSGPAPTARWATEYRGDIVSIRTAAGHVLSTTPDHPILTPGGWRAAKLLKPGNQVIRDAGIQRHANVMPDDMQVPSPIEHVGESRLPLFLAGPSRSDFDGNVTYGEIEVVRPDCELLDELDSALAQPFGDLSFISGSGLPTYGPSSGHPLAPLHRDDAATHCLVCRPEHGGTLFGSGALPALVHLGGDSRRALGGRQIGLPGDDAVVLRPGLDSGATQVVSHGPTADVEGGAELLRSLAGQIAPDEILSVGIGQFSGHVWDLTTGPSWMITNGIISHNCRPWEGSILSTSGRTAGYDTLREAEAAGLFHPNCRHSLAAWIPGVSAPHKGETADPQGDLDRQRLRQLERQLRARKRLEAAALDDAAAKRARVAIRATQASIREHVAGTTAKRQPAREQIGKAR